MTVTPKQADRIILAALSDPSLVEEVEDMLREGPREDVAWAILQFAREQLRYMRDDAAARRWQAIISASIVEPPSEPGPDHLGEHVAAHADDLDRLREDEPPSSRIELKLGRGPGVGDAGDEPKLDLGSLRERAEREQIG